MKLQPTNGLASLTWRAVEHVFSARDWWTHELQDIWADIVRRIAPSRAVKITIALDSAGGQILHTVGQRDPSAITFRYDANGKLPATRANFWPQIGTSRARVGVLLPESSVLIRDLVLPKGVVRNLASVVELQLERELPLPRDQVYVDWHVLSSTDSKVVVRVAIARRSQIETILTVLQGWRVDPISIGMKQSSPSMHFEFFKRSAGNRVEFFTPLNQKLAFVATALLFILLMTVSGQWWYERHQINPILHAIHSDAERVRALQAELEAAGAPAVTLIKMMQAPSTAEILSELTSALPAESWLQRLQVENKVGKRIELKMTAMSPSATSLVEQLRASLPLSHVRLASVISADSSNTKDRAEIIAEWDTSKLSPSANKLGAR